jgi:hypothetical protein
MPREPEPRPWEYKLVSMGNPLEADVELRANVLGKQGWELAAIDAGVWIFKRELTRASAEANPMVAIIEETVPVAETTNGETATLLAGGASP